VFRCLRTLRLQVLELSKFSARTLDIHPELPQHAPGHSVARQVRFAGSAGAGERPLKPPAL